MGLFLPASSPLLVPGELGATRALSQGCLSPHDPASPGTGSDLG